MYGMLKSQKPPPPSLVVFKDKYPPRDEERLKAISFKNPKSTRDDKSTHPYAKFKTC